MFPFLSKPPAIITGARNSHIPSFITKQEITPIIEKTVIYKKTQPFINGDYIVEISKCANEPNNLLVSAYALLGGESYYLRLPEKLYDDAMKNPEEIAKRLRINRGALTISQVVRKSRTVIKHRGKSTCDNYLNLNESGDKPTALFVDSIPSDLNATSLIVL